MHLNGDWEVGDYINVIFLDVDGVLNSMAYYKSLRKGCKKIGYNDISDFHLQMLAKVHNTCNARIVLSSTWRELDDESDINVYPMYQYLVDSLAKYDMKIISKTPLIHNNRPLEILTWLNNRDDKKSINFISLDDDFSKEDYKKYGIEKHLVRTKFFCHEESEGGLQQEHVDLAIDILTNKKGKLYELS